MPLAFRNLTARPEDPVDTWPTEAVQAALERGDLGDWRRLVRGLQADPWGKTAHQVQEVLGHARPYGVAELMETALERARRRAEAAERAAVSDELRNLVARSGLTQAAFAARMGTSPSRLSTYVNGSVVPSAALMIRARGVAAAESSE